MAQEHQTPLNEEKDFTLKELILKVKELFNEVIRSWKLLAVIGFLSVAFFLYKAISTPITFPAKISFMLNDSDGGGGLAGVGSILGSFGIGGGGGEYNLEKMMELSKTMNIIRKSLFVKTQIKGKNDFIANHLIDLYDLHEAWEEDTTGLQNFYFQNIAFDNYKRFENKALKQVYAKIIGNPKKDIDPILKSNIKDETGIMSLTINSKSEALSIQLVQIIYENLSQFYIGKTIEKQESTYDIVKHKVDSIKTVLQSTEYALADFKDSSLGLISKKAKLKEYQLQAKVSLLYEMLGEAIKNLEMADFSLKKATPVIQIIDAPFPPLEPAGESKLKAILLGGLLGGFLGIALIIARKLYRDALEE